MLTYVVRRLALALVVLLGIIIATFFMLHLVPGDPVKAALAGRASPDAIARARHQLGLDRPLLSQFWLYLSHTVQGNFGTSFAFNSSVGSVVGQRVGASAALIAYGMLLSLLIGVPLAIVASVRPNGWLDNSIRAGTTLTFAMPAFWLGLMLALIFGLSLKWFPVSGYSGGVGGILRTLTLPALALGLSLATVVVRTLRSSLLEVLQSEYIEAARSRGMGELRVVGKHAMRNSFMATLTLLAVNIGFLIGGTVVLEQVFQIPGVGSLLLDAVKQRDYATIQALALLAGAAVVLASLVADLTQAALDPRIRLAGR
jgi:peptide/nickel transport system permease protein